MIKISHKRQWIIAVCFIILCCFSGCNHHSDRGETEAVSDNTIQLHGIHFSSKYELSKKTFELPDEDILLNANAIMKALYFENSEEWSLIPLDISVFSVSLYNRIVTIQFSKEYYDLDATKKLLFVSGVVMSITQLDGVDGVNLMVNETSLTDLKGKPYGVLTANSFVLDLDKKTNQTEITLYFASEDGKTLVSEKREIVYSNADTRMRLVVENLIQGPHSPNLKPTLTSGVNILNVSTKDGICYVNFDNSFLTASYEVRSPLVLYSIVNSLTEIPEITQVQFLVNGRSDVAFKNSYELSNTYERDLNLIDDILLENTETKN